MGVGVGGWVGGWVGGCVRACVRACVSECICVSADMSPYCSVHDEWLIMKRSLV